MAEKGEVDVIRAKAGEMTRHLVCAFLDSIFLALWAAPNVYIGRFIEGLHVTGIDEIVLRCMQVLFGISTLAPICIWIYKDIRIMIKYANRDIEAAGKEPVVVHAPPAVAASPALGNAVGAGPEAPK